ncbi:adenylosuccinate synthetase [Candidatus Pacearchaeota archaeon]|nr:adenylosuccinate synthetase [Candidatus Pacearchaeota archaeon]
MDKKADLIVDMQYGSTGKGLIAGYLAMKNEYDVVVNANMPNAGHTFIDAKGQKMVHKVLPNGLVSPKCKYVLIGPSSVFSIDQLMKEIDTLSSFGYDQFQICIHHRAVVLQWSHKHSEEKYKRIGSTAQGSAKAMMHKMARNPEDNPTAGAILGYDDLELPAGVTVVNNDEYDDIIKNAKSILIEGAQGFSLGINERFYPYSTSRECTPARFMSDTGIPLPLLRTVIGCARTYPIRVGHTATGESGGHYPDQEETTWEALGLKKEFTTVTGRERRVFTFSHQQIKDAMWAIQPNEVFLNFCNYTKDIYELGPIMEAFNMKLKYLGWGATVNDVKEVSYMLGKPAWDKPSEGNIYG